MSLCLPCVPSWRTGRVEDSSIKLGRVPPKQTGGSSSQSTSENSVSENVLFSGESNKSVRPVNELDQNEDYLKRLRNIDEEYLRKARSFDVSKCEKMIAQVRGDFEARKLVQKLDKIEPALYAIDSFMHGISTIVQGLDSIAQIVWGSFQITLAIALRFSGLIDVVSVCITDLSKSLPRLREYSTIFPTDSVKASLGDMCICCVEFCAAVSKILSRRSIFNFLRLTWDPIDREFQRLQQDIERAKKDFYDEVRLAHVKSMAEWRQSTTDATTVPKIQGSKLSDVEISRFIMPLANNTLFFQRPRVTEKIESLLLPMTSSATVGLKSFLLHGLGGSGKTQIAINFAYTHWKDFDTVIWITADTEHGLAKGFLDAVKSLRLPHGEDPNSIKASLLHWLGNSSAKWLLIFDNVDSPELLLRYWPNSTKGSILITSRKRTFAQDLISKSLEVEPLDDADGVAMIQLTLQNLVPDAQNEKLVLEMASILCGMPLAITQMAGYILKYQMSVRRFLEIYKDRAYTRQIFRSTMSLGYEQYSKTLETVWKVSFERLSPDAQMILRIVVFLHPDQIPDELFQLDASLLDRPLPASLQVLDKSTRMLRYDDAISSVVSQFLMKRDLKECFLSIHRQVQQSALHELLDEEDTECLRTAFSGAVHVLYHAFPRQSPLGEPIPNWEVCQRYTTHVLHLLSCFEQEEKVRDEAAKDSLILLTELFCDCGVYLWERGLYADSERLAHASIRIAQGVLASHDCLKAQPYTLLGCVYLRSEHKAHDAAGALDTALRIREENFRINYKEKGIEPPLDIEIQLSNAYSNSGIAAKQLRNYEQAVRLHHRSVQIKEKRRQDSAGFLLAISYHNLGKLRRFQGNIEEAAKHFAACMDEMAVCQDNDQMKHRKGIWLCSLAEAEEALGRTNDAYSHFTQSLHILKEVVGDHVDTGMTSQRLGAFQYRAGKFEEARTLFKVAESIFSQTHLLSKTKLACSQYWLALTYARLGMMKEYEDTKTQASLLYQEITHKQISLDEAGALKEYESLVSDD